MTRISLADKGSQVFREMCFDEPCPSKQSTYSSPVSSYQERINLEVRSCQSKYRKQRDDSRSMSWPILLFVDYVCYFSRSHLL